jgi:hypothetical protein
MLATLTVDGWCVLPVFPCVSQALLENQSKRLIELRQQPNRLTELQVEY